MVVDCAEFGGGDMERGNESAPDASAAEDAAVPSPINDAKSEFASAKFASCVGVEFASCACEFAPCVLLVCDW